MFKPKFKKKIILPSKKNHLLLGSSMELRAHGWERE